MNLERPVTLAARLGGHIVQGHVDGVGEVVAVEPDGRRRRRLRDAGARAISSRYVVEKGSITVDGVSLTVAALARRRDRDRADPAHPGASPRWAPRRPATP